MKERTSSLIYFSSLPQFSVCYHTMVEICELINVHLRYDKSKGQVNKKTQLTNCLVSLWPHLTGQLLLPLLTHKASRDGLLSKMAQDKSRFRREKTAFIGMNTFSLPWSSFKVASFGFLFWRIKCAIELKQSTTNSRIWESWTPVESRLMAACCSYLFHSTGSPTLKFLSAKNSLYLAV